MAGFNSFLRPTEWWARLPLRRGQAVLLHGLSWGLLGVIVFTQPSGGLRGARYALLQGGLLLGLLAAFYLTLGWAVPRLLLRRRWLGLAGYAAAVALGLMLAHRAAERALRAAAPPAAPPPALAPDPPPPPAADLPPDQPGPSPPPEPAPGGRVGGRHGGRWGGRWLDPATLLTALLVLGLATSVGAVRHGEQVSQRQQALEQDRLATELTWLRAQLNPHFFFNTLNTIYALTMLEGGAEARQALHLLARLMRYVLYEAQAATTPLSQEVQFLRDYVALMQLRLTDSVRVELDLPAHLAEAPIAPLLLLPFLENAFKHGVSAHAPSRIGLRLRQPTPATLEVDLTNTRFARRPAATAEPAGGIGLATTRRRLALLYPGRHALHVSEPEGEFAVRLALTLRE